MDRHAEGLGQQLCAADDLLGHLQHDAVVGRDVGLALRRIDDHGVDLAQAAADLHMGGKRCAAASDDACVLDDLRQLFPGEFIGVLHGFDVLADRILMVVFNDHRHAVRAVEMRTRLHCDDRAGYTCVDRRRYEPSGFADFLSQLHGIPHCHDGFAGCADMKGHGNDNFVWSLQLFNCLPTGRVFHRIGMNAAKKCFCHCFHLI